MLQQDYLTVRSDLATLNQVQQWFEAFCLRHSQHFFWLRDQMYPLNLALAEGFTNAVRHAHHELPVETTIKIELSLWDDRIEIRIWDRGQPFDPNAIQEPQPGTLRKGGYGWFLLRRLADRVIYERQNEGNCLLIVKHQMQSKAAFDNC